MKDERVWAHAVALFAGIPPSTAVASPVIVPIIRVAAVIEVIAAISTISTSSIIAIATIFAVSIATISASAIIPIVTIAAVSIIAIAATASSFVGIAIGRGPTQREDIIIKVSRLGATSPLRARNRKRKGASRRDACGQKNDAEKMAWSRIHGLLLTFLNIKWGERSRNIAA
jgi:hypothetical protein